MTIRRALCLAAVRMLEKKKEMYDTRHVVISSLKIVGREKDIPINVFVVANSRKR